MMCLRCGQPIHHMSHDGDQVWVHVDRNTFACRDPRTGLLLASSATPAITHAGHHQELPR